LNLYIDEPNGKKLDIMYRMAWLRGLKTTYYLRSRSATTTEKSTISTGELNAVSATAQPEVQLQTNTTTPSACSVLDPDCDACQ
jgi:ribonucleoside-diphosphate reductase alpha chain